MGRKKEKKARKAAGRERAQRTGGAPPGPLAGIAATLAKKVDSPEGRQLLATGLTMAAAAASAALMKGAVHHHAAPSGGGEAPVPPGTPDAPFPPVPPVPPVPPQGTTTAPDPRAIGVALGKAAEQVLGAFLKPRPPG